MTYRDAYSPVKPRARALALNLAVSVALTAALRIVGARRAPDETVSDDYEELGEVAAERAHTVPA